MHAPFALFVLHPEHSRRCKAPAMLPSQPLLHAAVFALTVLQALASDTFIAAVYEHAVILPDATNKPVSPDDALALMNKNMDVLEGAIKEAAQQVLGVP